MQKKEPKMNSCTTNTATQCNEKAIQSQTTLHQKTSSPLPDEVKTPMDYIPPTHLNPPMDPHHSSHQHHLRCSCSKGTLSLAHKNLLTLCVNTCSQWLTRQKTRHDTSPLNPNTTYETSMNPRTRKKQTDTPEAEKICSSHDRCWKNCQHMALQKNALLI